MYRVGMDLRNGFWVYWGQHRMAGDASNGLNKGDLTLRIAEDIAHKPIPAIPRRSNGTISARRSRRPGPGLFDPPLNWKIFVERWQRLRPVYVQILLGWENIYDRLDGVEQDSNNGLDYPPLRLLTITLWTWRGNRPIRG